jgi:hypothetical protein
MGRARVRNQTNFELRVFSDFGGGGRERAGKDGAVPAVPAGE